MSILEISSTPRGREAFDTLGDVEDGLVGRPLSKSRSGKTVLLLFTAASVFTLGGEIEGVIGRSIIEFFLMAEFARIGTGEARPRDEIELLDSSCNASSSLGTD